MEFEPVKHPLAYSYRIINDIWLGTSVSFERSWTFNVWYLLHATVSSVQVQGTSIGIYKDQHSRDCFNKYHLKSSLWSLAWVSFDSYRFTVNYHVTTSVKFDVRFLVSFLMAFEVQCLYLCPRKYQVIFEVNSRHCFGILALIFLGFSYWMNIALGIRVCPAKLMDPQTLLINAQMKCYLKFTPLDTY